MPGENWGSRRADIFCVFFCTRVANPRPRSKSLSDLQTPHEHFYFYNTWSFVLKHFKPDAIHIKDTLVSKKLVDKLHLNNLAILAYTINDVDKLTELVKLKIDGIFTDFPKVMQAGRSLAH